MDGSPQLLKNNFFLTLLMMIRYWFFLKQHQIVFTIILSIQSTALSLQLKKAVDIDQQFKRLQPELILTIGGQIVSKKIKPS